MPTKSLTGILVATPFHPCGTTLTEWSLYTFKDAMQTQGPPGTTLSFYWRNHGEDCAEAYAQLVRYAWRVGARYVMFIEDDIFIPDGAIQALYYELNKAENADVAGVGGVYSWREGVVSKPFPLVFPHEGQGPKCDFTPGDIVEVEAAGQGCFLMRTDALVTQPEPWFALDWQSADSPVKQESAADLFFFQKLRSGIAPNGKPWRLLVHTGVVCEHLDRNSLEFSPPEWDLEYRERFGYAKDSELIRRVKRQREASGRGHTTGSYPSLLSEYGMSFGLQPQASSPAYQGPEAPERPIAAAIERVEAHRVTPGVVDAPPAAEPYRILNVGSGGCPVRDEVLSMLAQVAGPRPIEVHYNDHKDGAEHLAKELGLDISQWVVADAATLEGVADESYDAVYSSHLLEHIPIPQAVEAVRNWLRVLKPMGRLIIAVPDVSTIGQYVTDGKLDVVLYTAAGGLDITPRLILNGGQRYPGDTHVNSFDMRTLRDTCYRAGISERELWIQPSGLYECSAMVVKGFDLVSEMVRQRVRANSIAPAANGRPTEIIPKLAEVAD
jgi:2-polyprenyl-3-methyl-5-hydroxy-6-metoxy-1,4-benzoquinol methylase